MSADTTHARWFADHAEALEYPVGIVNILRELADEVDRRREDARVDDEDCAQALKTNGELCDNNAELTGDVITKWEPLLAAVKARFGTTITPNDFNATQEERTLAMCIAAFREKT